MEEASLGALTPVAEPKLQAVQNEELNCSKGKVMLGNNPCSLSLGGFSQKKIPFSVDRTAFSCASWREWLSYINKPEALLPNGCVHTR